MPAVTMRQMLECGVHFGHQTRFWNPKMSEYIFGERGRIHIINLEKALPLFNDAMNLIGRMAHQGRTILFVGTKRAARDTVREEAARCGMPFVDQRWLGGTLTNFRTIKQSIRRLHEIEQMFQDGTIERFNKKEQLGLRRQLIKLNSSLGGIKSMGAPPDAMFVIDTGHERIAVAEAKRLGIPVIGVVDTNNDPSDVDYVIPGNDDAIRAVQIYVQGAAAAVLEGKALALEQAGSRGEGDEGSAEGGGARARSRRPRKVEASATEGEAAAAPAADAS